MRNLIVLGIALCLALAVASGCMSGATPFDPPAYVGPGCECESCRCACQPNGFGPCHCSPESCDCDCPRVICDENGCRPYPEQASGALPVGGWGQTETIECPDPRLAADLEKEQREWFRNLSNPGSCVQCSLGMCGVDQGVPSAATLLWDTRFGKAEHHGSWPSRVADYARARGMRIYNVTGSPTYDWMKWACRNGRPVAIGCSTAHFQTLFGHDPETNEWFVCNNNSPQKIDTYSDAQFRRLHQASGQWCVILDYPPSPARSAYSAWWEQN